MSSDDGGNNDDKFTNDILKNKLMRTVKHRFSHSKSVEQIKILVLQDTRMTGDEVLRRDYDGNSQVDWLIEKMIGELLTQNKINH